ncbi:hypothetical protein [Aliarcobacter cryaerophilus]|uniref:hypothetical protein n=1 Tax=Aliarcobacter cryaerophilus TaxID=28198 RepID=UPI0021B1D045|nr:hypothetical protein [Aliarcobacter cryaerophilus]MCT7445518.1 hypothetical protein [Aliarcobacter cryaerophilus]MCT7480418.1 hypothetical protein [Aliarcobacter cryaerophilus]
MFLDFFTFSNISNIASISSLIISIITLYLIKGIKNKFLFRVNINSSITKIRNISSELVVLLGDFTNNKNDIEEKLKMLEVIVRNLKKGADNKNLIKNFKSISDEINQYFSQKMNKNEEFVRNTRLSIVTILEELKFEKENIKVGK